MHDEHKELIADIQYLEYLINYDRERFRTSVQARLSNATQQHDKANIVVDEFALALGKISARLAIVEKTLNIETSVEQLVNRASDNVPNTFTEQFVDELKIPITDLGFHNNLGHLCHSTRGMPFHWLYQSQSVVSDLYIDRTKKLSLAITVEDYDNVNTLKDCKIEIDGVLVKHKVIMIEDQSRLVCQIPKSNAEGKTHFSMTTPSGEHVKIGLSDVYCVPKMSLLKFVSTKLRFSK
ncbi:hypothetical protein [Thalassotalea euphylliae]|nr:hypothetical protein [Thalassotalea euphylliae]